MTDLPILPIHVPSIVYDTMHMTAEQIGCYHLLIYHAWDQGGLEPDDHLLARIARVTPRHWAAIKAPIMACWTLDAERGKFVQKRLARVKANVSKKVETSRANGANGGRPKTNEVKSEKPKDFNKTDNPVGSSQVNPNGTQGITKSLTQTEPKAEPGNNQQGNHSKLETKIRDSSSSSSSIPPRVEASTTEPPQAATEPPDAARSDDDEGNKLLKKVEEALGPKTPAHIAESLLPAIEQLLGDGCDLDRDVLPELRGIAPHGLRTRNPPFVCEQILARRDARLKAPPPAAPVKTVFVAVETPQWEAWDAYGRALPGRRKGYPTDKDGRGWHFPSEWPPGRDSSNPPVDPPVSPEVLH